MDSFEHEHDTAGNNRFGFSIYGQGSGKSDGDTGRIQTTEHQCRNVQPVDFCTDTRRRLSDGDLIGDADIIDAGTVTATLSPYYMANQLTTKAQWDTVRTWAASNGYTDLAVGAGKAANHPVQTVTWYEAIKWANAASEKEGLKRIRPPNPIYRSDCRWVRFPA
jgi:hypothetical protein